VSPNNESAGGDEGENMDEIIALVDLTTKGLPNKNDARAGQHGEDENLEDEAALAEVEAAEKGILQSNEKEGENVQHGEDENLEDEAALAEVEAAEKRILQSNENGA
ncbi:hypothetical protein MKW92_020889, partial [Papaver armeniacum]